jgi:hypothetical protein
LLALFTAAALASIAGACSSIGPASVSRDRFDYGAALAAISDAGPPLIKARRTAILNYNDLSL